MAENYKVGEKYYLPVTVYIDRSDEGGDFAIGIKYFDRKAEIRDYIQDNPGILLTADEIIDANIIQAQDNHKARYEEIKKRFEGVLKSSAEMSAEYGEYRKEAEKRIRELEADRDEWKKVAANNAAFYNEANKTASEAAEANDELKAKIAELKTERDTFAKTAKDKADLASKACAERDAAQGDLVTAREAIDYLQEENKKLKQELKDAEATYNVVADTSIKRKNRVTTMEEVIVALVEKIRGLEGGET